METRIRTPRRVPASLRRPLATVSMLGMVTAIAAGMVFATQTLLARQLGPAGYGLFASSLVTVTMVAPLAGFGLMQFQLKAYGMEGWGAHRWLKPSLRFIGFTTLLALGLALTWALAGAHDDGTRFDLLVLSPVILSVLAVALVTNKMRLEDRYRAMALWQIVTPGGRLIVVAALLLIPQMNHRFVAIGYCAVALLATLWTLPHLRKLIRGEVELKGHGPRGTVPTMLGAPPTLTQVWSQAWAYGVVAVLYPIFFRISTVLLKYLSSDTQAGLYAIAMSVMAAIYLIPSTIYQKYLLAKLHRWAAHDKPKFWLVYRKAGLAMAVLGLLIGGVLAAVAPWLVPLVFGAEYRGAATVLVVLSPCVPIRFLSTAIGSVLLTEDHMRYRVYATGLATVVVILLNIMLIPRLGALGAAGATVLGEAALLLVTYYCVRRFVAPNRRRNR